MLDNIDMSTLSKGKTPASTNDVEFYSKEQLTVEINKLLSVNI